jgi:orotate phosphoribosyltransferase
MTTDSRALLLQLLSRISFKLGEFKLSSGGTSDYYIDCRTTTLHAEGGRLTGLALLDLMHQHKLHPQAVGGLTMGADPVVSSVAAASAWRAHQDHNTSLIHGFLVRKTEKVHGTGRRIEGFLEKGAAVVIVDDVCTTGASTIDAIQAADASGMRVIGALCLVERTEAKGRPAVESALAAATNSAASSNNKAEAPFLSLYTADDVRAAHVAHLAM